MTRAQASAVQRERLMEIRAEAQLRRALAEAELVATDGPDRTSAEAPAIFALYTVQGPAKR